MLVKYRDRIKLCLVLSFVVYIIGFTSAVSGLAGDICTLGGELFIVLFITLDRHTEFQEFHSQKIVNSLMYTSVGLTLVCCALGVYCIISKVNDYSTVASVTYGLVACMLIAFISHEVSIAYYIRQKKLEKNQVN